MSAPFIAGLFFFFLGVYLFIHAVKSFRRYTSSISWPSVMGKVLSGEVVRYDATSSRYDFVVSYYYVVNDTKFKGNRAVLWTVAHKDDAEYLHKKFVEGEDVPVYYQPNDPEISVLEPGSPRHGKKYSDMILSVFGMVFGLVIASAGYLGYLD